MGWIAAAAAVVSAAGSYLGNNSSTKATAGEKQMLARTNMLTKTAGELQPFEHARLADLSNAQDERRAMVGKSVTGLSQAVGAGPEANPYADGQDHAEDIVEQGSLRNKAQVRVAQGGDAAIEQKMLMDRTRYLDVGLNKAKISLGMDNSLVGTQVDELQRSSDLKRMRTELISDAVGFGLGAFYERQQEKKKAAAAAAARSTAQWNAELPKAGDPYFQSFDAPAQYSFSGSDR